MLFILPEKDRGQFCPIVLCFSVTSWNSHCITWTFNLMGWRDIVDNVHWICIFESLIVKDSSLQQSWFFLGSKCLKNVLKALKKILFWGINWSLMAFETNSLKMEIFTAFVTLETEISTSYMTLETNVLSLSRFDNLWKI